MSLFKSYKFSWQQIGVFKLALLSIGAIGGAYYDDFVRDYILLFVAIAITTSFYIMFVSLSQNK